MDLLEYYGFKEDPFKFTPDPAFYFQSQTHQECYTCLEYSVKQREGFTLIIGEPGTGKTMLLKVFLDNWKERAEIALIMIPRLSPSEFLLTLLEDFGIDYQQKTNKVNIFKDFLLEKAKEDKIVIIIVDEAQNLPNETIEELRLLSNLETNNNKLLHIILFGQPELNEKLNAPELRQLEQRIITRNTLDSLSEADTYDYIKSRIFRASTASNLQLDKKAMLEIYKKSNGIPRIINTITSRALMSSYLEESNSLKKHHVKQGIKSIKTAEKQKIIQKKGFAKFLKILLLITIIMSGIYFYNTEIIKPYISEEKKIRPSQSTNTKNQDVVISVNSPSPVEKKINIGHEEKKLKQPLSKHVAVKWAKVRDKPNLKSNIISYYSKGKVVTIVGSKKDNENRIWYKIERGKNLYGCMSENVLN